MIKSLKAKSNLSKYRGSWAVITASTDGIGLGFAEECAKEGMNIVQICRNPEKMKSVSNSLKSSFGVEVLSIEFDFAGSLADPIKSYSSLYSKLENLDISLIVNNIGTGKRDSFDNIN